MGFYHTAQICLNGHMINGEADKYLEHNELFCSICGAKTVTSCLNCGMPIRGTHEEPGVLIIGDSASVRSYCHNCGKPYPWTVSAIEATMLLIQEEEEFSEQLKNSLSDSLPDIISETPKTNLAITRIKKALSFAGNFTAEGIRQFVIDFGCELAKQSLGL